MRFLYLLVTAGALLSLAVYLDPRPTPEHADAAFHSTRVYGVLGGAFDDSDIQYVELRMVSGGQTQVGGHDICFYREDGDAWARFTFPGNVSNGAPGSSVIIGSIPFDLVWGPTPDFVFAPVNTTAIAASADPSAPIFPFSGKVAFGSDGATEPSQMCGDSFTVIDSVAYGDYFGNVDFGSNFPDLLDTDPGSVLKLVGPLCDPASCNPPRDNSEDYRLRNPNVEEHWPRNNAGASGPLTEGGEPTPTPSPAPTSPPTPPPGEQRTWGDVDCDGQSAPQGIADAITTRDNQAELRFVLEQNPLSQTEPCPDIGSDVVVDGEPRVWGDEDCDGEVTTRDNQAKLRFVLDQDPLSQEKGCPDVGATVVMTEA